MTYATTAMVNARLKMVDADSDAEAITEFLRSAHAEVSAVLRQYGIDPDAVDSTYNDYGYLQGAEADMAAGLLAETIPGEEDKSSAQKRHILYARGREALEKWAMMRQDETASVSTYRAVRQRSTPAGRREDYVDEYLN